MSISDFPAVITPDGQTRILTLLPSSEEQVARYRQPPLASLDPAQIIDFESWPAEIKIKDQDGVGACVHFAGSYGIEYTRATHYGPSDYQALDPYFSYGLMVHGRDRGSSIAESLGVLEKYGMPPEGMIRDQDYSGNYSQAVYKAADGYRIALGRVLETWGEILTEVALRRAVVIAVDVTNAYMRVDAEGVPGPARGAANHGIVCAGGIKTSKKWGKLVHHAGSWGTSWGVNGFGWIAEAHTECRWFEAYTTTLVSVPLHDLVPPA